jgi:hypothetical protein
MESVKKKSTWYFLEGIKFQIKTRYSFDYKGIIIQDCQSICLYNYSSSAMHRNIIYTDTLHFNLSVFNNTTNRFFNKFTVLCSHRRALLPLRSICVTNIIQPFPTVRANALE